MTADRHTVLSGEIVISTPNQAPRFYERFTISLNPDGGRTLRALTVSPRGNLIRDVAQMVRADWTPVSGGSRLFLDGQLCGAVNKFVCGQTIHSVVHDGDMLDQAEFPAPERFTLGFHPIADEAWKMVLGPTEPGARAAITTHTCSQTWNGKTIGHGATVVSDVEYVGETDDPTGLCRDPVRAYLWFTPFGKLLKIWVGGAHNLFVALEVLEGDNAGTRYQLSRLTHEAL